MRIIHIMTFEKFIRDYIQFIEKNLEVNDHYFLIIGTDYKKYDLSGLPNVIFINNYRNVFNMIFRLHIANRIILHGLWDERVIKILLCMPWLIKKCYWMLWGGDFYYPETKTLARKKLIKKIKHFVGFIKDDYLLIREWYGAKGEFHECILYPVAFFEEDYSPNLGGQKGTIKILAGNSADPSNNHFDLFEKLIPYKEQDIQIIVPLSYGNGTYSEDVIKKGKEIFGDKFVPLTDFISLSEYKKLLKDVDIAIFNHDRQQGMGNIISLISYGKKVYIRSHISTWKMFNSFGVTVFDCKNFDLTLPDKALIQTNIDIMKNYFTKENYINQLKALFYK